MSNTIPKDPKGDKQALSPVAKPALDGPNNSTLPMAPHYWTGGFPMNTGSAPSAEQLMLMSAQGQMHPGMVQQLNFMGSQGLQNQWMQSPSEYLPSSFLPVSQNAAAMGNPSMNSMGLLTSGEHGSSMPMAMPAFMPRLQNGLASNMNPAMAMARGGMPNNADMFSLAQQQWAAMCFGKSGMPQMGFMGNMQMPHMMGPMMTPADIKAGHTGSDDGTKKEEVDRATRRRLSGRAPHIRVHSCCFLCQGKLVTPGGYFANCQVCNAEGDSSGLRTLTFCPKCLDDKDTREAIHQSILTIPGAICKEVPACTSNGVLKLFCCSKMEGCWNRIRRAKALEKLRRPPQKRPTKRSVTSAGTDTTKSTSEEE